MNLADCLRESVADYIIQKSVLLNIHGSCWAKQYQRVKDSGKIYEGILKEVTERLGDDR